MKHILTLLIIAWLATAPAAADTADAHTDAQIRAMKKEAQQVTKELVSELGAALKQALSESGPDGAISVCRDTKPRVARLITLWLSLKSSPNPRVITFDS